MADYKQEYEDFLHAHLKRLQIVKTTCTPSGQTIDWIPVESQGEVCSPPPPPTQCKSDGQRPESFPLSELQLPGAEHGPEGTVPILRPNFKNADFSVPLKEFLNKRAPPMEIRKVKSPTDESGIVALDGPAIEPFPHWYASTSQFVDSYGCRGEFSAFGPNVDNPNDFSLIQLGLVRLEGAKRDGRDVADNRQTLEAGWQRSRQIYGDNEMHLFSAYTTDIYIYEFDQGHGYTDYVGGYNAWVAGWKQYDRDLYPACTYSPLSTDGGPQYKMWLVYQLWRGNWWLWCNDRWLGYYPGSLYYTKNAAIDAAPDPAITLGDHADWVGFWGEVNDSVDSNPGTTNPTTTDMGSGKFAETHWQHSAYVHNMLVQTDVSREPDGHNDSNTDYGGNPVDTYHYDPKRYDHEDHFDGEDSWGSFMWLGGPGFVPGGDGPPK